VRARGLGAGAARPPRPRSSSALCASPSPAERPMEAERSRPARPALGGRAGGACSAEPRLHSSGGPRRYSGACPREPGQPGLPPPCGKPPGRSPGAPAGWPTRAPEADGGEPQRSDVLACSPAPPAARCPNACTAPPRPSQGGGGRCATRAGGPATPPRLGSAAAAAAAALGGALAAGSDLGDISPLGCTACASRTCSRARRRPGRGSGRSASCRRAARRTWISPPSCSTPPTSTRSRASRSTRRCRRASLRSTVSAPTRCGSSTRCSRRCSAWGPHRVGRLEGGHLGFLRYHAERRRQAAQAECSVRAMDWYGAMLAEVALRQADGKRAPGAALHRRPRAARGRGGARPDARRAA